MLKPKLKHLLKLLQSSPGMSIYIDSFNAYGADGVVERSGVERSDSRDHFFSMEHVSLDLKTQETHSNYLTVNDDTLPLDVDFRESRHGWSAVLSTSDSDEAKGLKVSNVNYFDLSNEIGEHLNTSTLMLAGKLDLDGKLDSDKSDDNYKISWNGDTLRVDGSPTGNIGLEGVGTVEFYHPQIEHARETFFYQEFAEKAIDLGLHLVKDPVFEGDEQNEIVLREFGNEAERASKFYVALTAESLRDAKISTLDVSFGIGKSFDEVFELDHSDIHFTTDLAVQRHINLEVAEDGSKVIRYTGAGLDSLDGGETGNAIGDRQVLAYIGLQQKEGLTDDIIQQRVQDQYGFDNKETFMVKLDFDVDANVDSVVWDDQYTLRDLGGQYAMMNENLEIVARSAESNLVSSGQFDLGTYRETTKSGDGEYTNLVRSGDTITETNTWQNEGEFTFVDMVLTSESRMSLMLRLSLITAKTPMRALVGVHLETATRLR